MQIADDKIQTSVKSYDLNGRSDGPLSVSFPDRFHDAYMAELSHFLDVVQGKYSGVYIGIVLHFLRVY